MSEKSRSEVNKTEQTRTPAEQTQIHWDQTKMKTTYANVCNVFSSREEVSVLFGTNQTVDPAQNGINVELTNRIVMNPYAARRLANILTGVLKQYETNYGVLPVD